MTQPPAQQAATTPAMLRMATIALCVLACVTAVPWIYLSLGTFGGFVWGLFGFELLVVLSALMTILVCLGRIKVGGAFPLALVCFVGVLMVTSVFGIYVGARNVVGDNHPDVQPWVMRTLLVQVATMGGLCLIAMLDVYRRDARSWALAIRSLPFLVPVLAIAVYFQRSGIPTVTNAAGELSQVRMVAFILGGLLLGILLSVGGHLLIRSFEVALPEKTSTDDA
ncbi:MAG: hypothetical protein R3B67_08130 [Phycisphaerales bacterium]